MREQLIAYVQQLFDRAADTPRNRELQEEILQNTLDRYDDLVAQGVSEGTAYAQAVDQLGDVSKLWEAGPKKQGRHRGGLGLLRWDLSGAAETLKEVGRQTAGKATVRYGEPETYTAGAAVIPAANIARVKLEWYAGTVTVERGNGEAIELRESRVKEPAHQLRWRVRDDTLEIRFVQPGTYLRLPEKLLTVSLPHRLAELAVQTVSADLDAEDVDAEKLQVETVSGDGDVSGRLESFKWQSVSGDLDFQGRAAVMRVGTVSGDADLELEATPDLLTAELVSGDLELTLPEDRSFRLRRKTVSGDFESELPLTKLGKKEWQYNAAGKPADFQIETVSGDVTVNCG